MRNLRAGPACLSLLSALLLPGGDARAEGTNDWLPELEVWGSSVEGRGGGGYRDNLLLDRDKQEESYFLSTGADATVWRLPVDRHQFFLLLSGDYFRYPDGRILDDEATGVALAEYKNLLTPSLEFAGALQYSYLDQVIGVVTETNFSPTPVVAHITGVRPSLRQYLSPRWWLELEGYGSRQFFQDPLDDLWEAGPRLRAGHDYGRNSSLQWTYYFTYRIYDGQPALGADGMAIDRVLRMEQHDWNVSWIHEWDEARHWRTSSHVSLQLLRDNGSGFFDFNRYQARQQVRYRRDKWEIEGQARLAYYDFQIQRSEGISGPRTEKVLAAFQIKASREILKNVKVFLHYDFEEALSNRDEDDYASNKIGAGVDWEF